MATLNHSQSILAGLPVSFVAAVKSHLGAYGSAYITRKDNGDYHCTSAIVLHNGQYQKQLGEVLASEVLTNNERVVAYVKNFRDFPYRAGSGAGLTYHGHKDWKALNSDWSDVSIGTDGNLIFTH